MRCFVIHLDIQWKQVMHFLLFPCRNLENVDFDVERFMKEIESVMKLPHSNDTGSEVAAEEGSSSDMEFGKWLI